MPKSRKTHDVFLSHSLESAPQAKVVAQRFEDAGLSVFDASEVGMGQKALEEVWQALAESWAVVVLVAPGTMPPSVAVEIGGASAWHKPIYVLTESKDEGQMPLYITKFEVFDISEAGKVVELVQSALRPLTDDVRDALVRSYTTSGVPTDCLLRHPALIERLRDSVKAASGANLSGERIMQELLRLRKRGRLPRLQRRTEPNDLSD
jgi:hypothetical protein